ncbi:hypothetical protein B0T22DRAFT_167017 [Podospora appendiculata]|uniref:Uncharacterized protein n=1 Tax=Podospora appendiculata TaxID=314037 RepID=A0AAE0XB86_9PEZI|nr:hypothetical protein B0T22DRAFT_167017 [Podospora appendiculata]
MEGTPLAIALAVVILSVPTMLSVAARVRRRRNAGDVVHKHEIHTVFDPPDARVEIMALHGLGAHPNYTWIGRAPAPDPPGPPTTHTWPFGWFRRPVGPSPARQEVHLLKDLLTDDVPNARIRNYVHVQEVDEHKAAQFHSGLTFSPNSEIITIIAFDPGLRAKQERFSVTQTGEFSVSIWSTQTGDFMWSGELDLLPVDLFHEGFQTMFSPDSDLIAIVSDINLASGIPRPVHA